MSESSSKVWTSLLIETTSLWREEACTGNLFYRLTVRMYIIFHISCTCFGSPSRQSPQNSFPWVRRLYSAVTHQLSGRPPLLLWYYNLYQQYIILFFQIIVLVIVIITVNSITIIMSVTLARSLQPVITVQRAYHPHPWIKQPTEEDEKQNIEKAPALRNIC